MKETSGFLFKNEDTSVLKHNFGLFFVLLVGDFFSFSTIAKSAKYFVFELQLLQKKKSGAALLKLKNSKHDPKGKINC